MINFMQFMQMAKNPQAFMEQILNNSELMQNPIAKNAVEMYQKGDTEGINNLVNNLCKEKNIKPEDVYKQARSMFGM